MRFIDVLVTCPDFACAETIARSCVSDKLAACANVGGPITSIYRWDGVVETSEEVSLMLKTREALFGTLSARVKALHPYEVPCIIASEIVMAEPAYAAWLEAETG
jgi:periplasmic divalent cation tolerance protein